MSNIQNKEMWSKATNIVFAGVVLFSVGMIASWGYSMFFTFKLPLLVEDNAWETIDTFHKTLLNIELIASIACPVGYLLFMLGLGKFKKISNETDGKAVEKIRIAAIIALIVSAITFQPLINLYPEAIMPHIGWIVSGIFLIAYSLMLMGYIPLKSSQTFPNSARNGLTILIGAVSLTLLGALIGVITDLASDLFARDGVWYARAAIYIIAFILMIAGWWKVKTADVSAEEVQHEPQPEFSHAPQTAKKVLSPDKLKTLEQLVVNSKEGGFSLEQIRTLTNLPVEQINEILKWHGL